MRNTIVLGLSLLLVIICACSAKKPVVKDTTPQIHAVNPYSQKTLPGIPSAEITVKLVIPLYLSPSDIEVDSVYFMGQKEMLHRSESDSVSVFKARFKTKSAVPVDPPYELKKGEAAVVYHHKEQRHLLKVTGIEAKPHIYMP